jgi:hypothetical protein
MPPTSGAVLAANDDFEPGLLEGGAGSTTPSQGEATVVQLPARERIGGGVRVPMQKERGQVVAELGTIASRLQEAVNKAELLAIQNREQENYIGVLLDKNTKDSARIAELEARLAEKETQERAAETNPRPRVVHRPPQFGVAPSTSYQQPIQNTIEVTPRIKDQTEMREGMATEVMPAEPIQVEEVRPLPIPRMEDIAPRTISRTVEVPVPEPEKESIQEVTLEKENNSYAKKLEITNMIFSSDFAQSPITLSAVLGGNIIGGIAKKEVPVGDPLRQSVESLRVLSDAQHTEKENEVIIYNFLKESTTPESFALSYFSNALGDSGKKITFDQAKKVYQQIKDDNIYDLYYDQGKDKHVYKDVDGIKVDVLREASQMVKDLLHYTTISGITMELEPGSTLEKLFIDVKRFILMRAKQKAKL